MSSEKSLERRLIELSWRDESFATLAETHAKAALTQIGVDVPDDIDVEIIIQRRDTLYYVIPPSLPENAQDAIINQMDLWQSAELFCWIMPQNLKLGLLSMRQSYRRNGK